MKFILALFVAFVSMAAAFVPAISSRGAIVAQQARSSTPLVSYSFMSCTFGTSCEALLMLEFNHLAREISKRHRGNLGVGMSSRVKQPMCGGTIHVLLSFMID